MESKKIFIWGEIWGETIKDHHSKIEVQNNIYWTPGKFNINIPSQQPALSSRPSITKTTNEEHQEVEGVEVCCSKEQLLEEVTAILAKLYQKRKILSPKIFPQIHHP